MPGSPSNLPSPPSPRIDDAGSAGPPPSLSAPLSVPPPSFAGGSAAAAEIGLCLLLSAADGEVSEEELVALTDRVGVLLGDDFDPLELGLIVDRELRTIDELGSETYIANLPARIAVDRRSPALRAACAVACADGLSPDEEAVVREVADVLGIETSEIEMGDAEDRVDTIPAPTRPVTSLTSEDDEHEDEPNDVTRLVASHLEGCGWVDPAKLLRGAGISVGIGGSGALTREYQAPDGRLLRLEHHTCDGSVRVQVTDESDDVLDLVLLADGREQDLLATLVQMQNELSVTTIESQLPVLLEVSRVVASRNGERLNGTD